MFEVLIGLVVLTFPAVAIAALVKASAASERLRQLDLRVAALERERSQPPVVTDAVTQRTIRCS